MCSDSGSDIVRSNTLPQCGQVKQKQYNYKVLLPCFQGGSSQEKEKTPKVEMTRFFANIRGVEHPNKQRFLREIIRYEGVYFIGLIETIKCQFTP
jgi:hypothetical protein